MKHHETLEHSPFDATILARQHRRSRGVSGDLVDWGVGITSQMYNRVTNHGDIGTFSKPDQSDCDVTAVAWRYWQPNSLLNLNWLH